MKYRKKPIVVDAEVYKPGMEDGYISRCTWYEEPREWNECKSCFSLKECQRDYFVEIPYIETLEGKMLITRGDYIITGVKGERYPCKPDIFHMTYELVKE
jgi:hypothetical protein